MDKQLELTQGFSPGRRKAEEATKAVGGKVFLPVFAPNEGSYPSHLETVTPEKFRRAALSEEQHAALARMKLFTDFNDLATRSVLGRESVARQLRSVLDTLQQQKQQAHSIAKSERSAPRRKRLRIA